MTLQEIFDKVTIHLLTQNEKSEGLVAGSPTCLYRGPGGAKCAVGCLIPDNLYVHELEGKSSTTETVMDVVIEATALDYDDETTLEYLLCDLQDVHDGRSVHEWPRKLAALAAEEGFTLPPLLRKRLGEAHD